MGRRKAVRQPLRQPVRPRQVNGSTGKRQPVRVRQSQVSLHVVLWLFQRYRFLLWLAVWAILVGTATAALMSLVDPNASVQYGAASKPSSVQLIPQPQNLQNLQSSSPQSHLQKPPQLNSVPENVEQVQTPSNSSKSIASKTRQPERSKAPPSPVFAIAAIMLSCAGGCFLFSQWLKPQASRRRIRRPIELTQPRSLQSSKAAPNRAEPENAKELEQQPAHPLPAALPPAKVTAFELSPLQQPTQPTDSEHSAESPTAAQPTQSEPASEVAKVVVTIVSDDQSHPLDWDEPSLADSLDLRQRRPLSYWL